MDEKKSLWLIAVQRTDTKKNTYFNQYGNNPDEVLNKMSEGFFDKKLSFITMSPVSVTELKRSDHVAFPTSLIKVLCVKKCRNIEEFQLFKDMIQNDW